MTTSSTSTVLDHTGDAGFRAWVAEIINQLVTTCGLTQTSDTGQIDTSTVSRPSTSSAGGYSIFSFNDTLQSTSPVFIKLEYGTAGSANNPQMWVTIGQGSNGSGTLTGTLSTRVAVLQGNAPSSTSTSYTSRYVYNSTFGYLALVFKIGSLSANLASGALIVFRSNDTSGDATGDAVMVMANSNTATGSGSSSSVAYMQCYSYGSNAMFPALIDNSIFWAAGFSGAFGTGDSLMPFHLSSTTHGGDSYVTPVYYLSPIPSISAYNCVALLSEAALGSTFSCAVVGSSALTFLSVQTPFGSAGLAGIGTTTNTFCILWQ